MAKPNAASGPDYDNKKSRPRKKNKKNNNRDLAALLTHGASLWPYTGAWTDSRIEQVRHMKHWVYVAIDRIATKIAQHPPNVSYCRNLNPYSLSANDKLFALSRRKALTPLQSHEILSPVEDDHPLKRLLRDPNEPDTSYDLWYETLLFLLLTGSAYWWCPKNALGIPEAIWVVPSHWVWPVPGKDKTIEFYEIRPVEGNYIRKVVPADEFIHFRRKNPISRLDGLSPLTAISNWIDVEEANSKAQWWAYTNGTFPTLAVQFDSDVEDPDEEQLRRIEAKFIARQVGPTRSNKPLFLPPGVKVVPLSIEPNKMVFGETGKETRDKVLAAFGVPHVIAGIDTHLAHGAGTAIQSIFLSYTINPLSYFLSQVVTEKLGNPNFGYDDTQVRVWWEDRTPDDPATLEQQLKTDLLYGARTPNEVRAIRGLEPYDEADVPWCNKPLLPVNMQQGTLPGGGDHIKTGEPSADYEHPPINDSDYKSWLDSRHSLMNPGLNGHSSSSDHHY